MTVFDKFGLKLKQYFLIYFHFSLVVTNAQKFRILCIFYVYFQKSLNFGGGSLSKWPPSSIVLFSARPPPATCTVTAITLSCNIFGFSFYTPAQFHPQTLNTQKDFKNTGKCEYLNYRMICFKILLKSSSKRLRKLQRKCSFFMFQVSPPSKWNQLKKTSCVEEKV